MDSESGEGPAKLYKWLTVLVLVIIAVVAVLAVAWVILQWSIAESVYSAKAGLNWFSITFYHDYTFLAAGLFALLLVYPKPGGATSGSYGPCSPDTFGHTRPNREGCGSARR